MAHAKEGTTLLPLHDLNEKTYQKLLKLQESFYLSFLFRSTSPSKNTVNVFLSPKAEAFLLYSSQQ